MEKVKGKIKDESFNMDVNKLISVATITYNCANILKAYIEEVTEILSKIYKYYEIIIIDNGSTDDTIETVRQLMKGREQVRIIVLSRHYDEQITWTAALENSIGDYVVLMDINTDPPGLIPELIELSASGADIVTAETRERKNDPMLYRILTKIFYDICNLFTEYRLDLNWSNYVCFSRKVVNSLTQVKSRIRYLKYLKMEIGFSHKIIQYDQINRSGGKLRKRIINRFFFAIETLFSSSDKVLKLATSFALLISLINMGYIVFAIGIKIFQKDLIGGWASTSVVLSLMFAFLFLFLFIIGSYIGIIHKETRKSPLYYIADEYTNTDLFKDLDGRNVV